MNIGMGGSLHHDNPDRLGGAETNTVTRELVVNMVTEASLVVLTVRNTQPEQIGPDQTRRLEEIMSQQSGLVVGEMMELFSSKSDIGLRSIARSLCAKDLEL